MCHISHMFLECIAIDILDSICWNDIEYINSNRLKRSTYRLVRKLNWYVIF